MKNYYSCKNLVLTNLYKKNSVKKQHLQTITHYKVLKSGITYIVLNMQLFKCGRHYCLITNDLSE